jgi:type IV secretion system protein VirB8
MSGMTEREDYYAEASSWHSDVNGALRASRRRAYWLAGAALAIAALEALALVLLLPLKTVVPYTIMIDRQTGMAEPARGVLPGAMAENEAVLRSLLAQYVLARESLDATDLPVNFRKIGLWSAGTARSDYLREFDRANPGSVLHTATSATQISTAIVSITRLGNGSALVRFSTDRRDGDGPITRRHWAAALAFGFSPAPLTAQDRLINPLGFQVARYRRDEEAELAVVQAR